jgi:hypothetical protein
MAYLKKLTEKLKVIQMLKMVREHTKELKYDVFRQISFNYQIDTEKK